MPPTFDLKTSLRRAFATRTRKLVVGALVALAAWAFLIEPRRLVVSSTDLPLERWPSGIPPLRIALLSDLHVGSPHWGSARLRGLVERTNAEHPDIVLLAGDYVIDHVLFGTKVEPEAIADGLAELRAPHGVVAVLGNHDWRNDGERMRRALVARKIVVLENEVFTFVHAGKTIAIAGLADQTTRAPRPRETFDAAPTGVPILALVHEPDVFVSIDDRASLTLAGHTHGGQVRLPFVGRLVVPSEFGQKYAAGHVLEGSRHLFVTTGIGTSILPVRFGVPPEIAVLTVHAAD